MQESHNRMPDPIFPIFLSQTDAWWEVKSHGPSFVETITETITPASGSDCHRFANKVRSLAKDYLDQRFPEWANQVQSFMNALVSWGSEYKSATLSAFTSGKQTSWTQHMNSTGFKSEFTDVDKGSSDQVRHAIGGLMAGYVGAEAGTNAVSIFMNNVRESDWWANASEESHAADIALNNSTIPQGALMYGGNGISNAMKLADWIESNLCVPKAQDGGRRSNGGF